MFGGVTAVLRSSPTPRLWTLAAGVQWALLGGTFWGIRETLLESQIREKTTSGMTVLISTVSGCTAFILVGAITRKSCTWTIMLSSHRLGGRNNIVPGAIVGSISGGAGQWSYNMYQQRKQQIAAQPRAKPENSLFYRLLSSPYSPIRRLSDQDWEEIIGDKMLKVDVEIALIDDQIAALKKEQRENDPEAPS